MSGAGRGTRVALPACGVLILQGAGGQSCREGGLVVCVGHWGREGVCWEMQPLGEEPGPLLNPPPPTPLAALQRAWGASWGSEDGDEVGGCSPRLSPPTPRQPRYLCQASMDCALRVGTGARCSSASARGVPRG